MEVCRRRPFDTGGELDRQGQKTPQLAGLVVLFPGVTVVGYYFLSQSIPPEGPATHYSPEYLGIACGSRLYSPAISRHKTAIG